MRPLNRRLSDPTAAFVIETITQESVIRLATQQSLPAPPQVVMRLLKVIQSEDFSLADIVDVVESDVSAAATVMAAANTAATRGVNEVTSVRDAVTRLGAQATRDRVMHQAMQSAFQPRHPALAGLLSKEWALAAQVATLLRQVSCAEIGLEDADTAFTMGLFHNVGMVPLLSAAPALVNIGSASDYYVAARHHASALGGVLAKRWHLGAAVYETALNCLRPATAEWGAWGLVRIARQVCAQRIGHGAAVDEQTLSAATLAAQEALQMTDIVAWMQEHGAEALSAA